MTNFVQRFALVTVLAVASLWSAGCSSSVTRTRMDRFGWRSTWTGRPCYRRIGGSLPCTPRVHGSMFTVREKERWPVAGLFHCHRFGDSLTGICAEATDVRTSPASTLIQDCDMGCPH